MIRSCSFFAIIVAAALSTVAAADEVSLDSVPPVVVATVPTAGSADVDPKTTEIKVTFSKAMADGMWSWSTLTKDSYPEVGGKPQYAKDQRTCILPVKLKPGKTYAIWVNSDKFRNFKDERGTPAVPYLLVFSTSK